MTPAKMVTREYKVRFLTPAFLGNAEQAGEWRTPPFKAVLRQWWRMAVAEDAGYDYEKIRIMEAVLFGHAWLKEDRDESGKAVAARQSRVRIRLGKWDMGKLETAPAIGSVTIKTNSLPGALYSGYGPVVQGPRLKAKPAIGAGDSTTLRLAFPAAEVAGLERALALLHRFGTVGGRSRNGWGSFALEGGLAPTALPLVEWRRAMKRDWAHCIGFDNAGALIWEAPPQQKWEDAMNQLAQLRADMRRAVSERLLLAYPDTEKSLREWKDDKARVPHSLRFKVRAEGSGYVASVFHVPCRPSDALWAKLSSALKEQLPEVFAQAHRFLDIQPALTRVAEGTAK